MGPVSWEDPEQMVRAVNGDGLARVGSSGGGRLFQTASPLPCDRSQQPA